MIFACLIFPVLFICCNWWKKKVYPKYEVTLEAYQTLGSTLSSIASVNDLSLNVVDNAFNTEKAQTLHGMLKDKQIQSFSFQNSTI